MTNNAYLSTSSAKNVKVAVVLSGCGVYDGSEIHEASACLVHLSRAQADVAVFAPDVNQMHVLNHVTGQPVPNQTRNVLEESGRIARGRVQKMTALKASTFDALLFPGGFGVAKNISTFAVDGVEMVVNEEVEKAILDFHVNHKPIGFCCIAPILAAKCIKGVEVTMGRSVEGDDKWPHSSACTAAKALGAVHVEKDVHEVHVDTNKLVVTTPAYMCDAYPHEVFDGVGLMIEKLLEMTHK